MAKINTEPLSGMRDFLPLDVLRRNHVIGVIERVYQSYGFEPLQTPTMERLTTLLGKYGDEGDQLIFRVLKRGDKLERALADSPAQDSIADAGMRYDLTVPLARVVAEYRERLPRFFKRYQIQPVYRADRPAKGRYREFYQCDVDVVGSISPTVEAEVIAAGVQVLEELGFSAADAFRVRLNHRGILHALMEAASIPPALEGDALVAIDKLDKIGLEGVRAELAHRGIADDAAGALLESMSAAPQENGSAPGTSNDAVLDWLDALLAATEAGPAAVANLRNRVPGPQRVGRRRRPLRRPRGHVQRAVDSRLRLQPGP
jgi:histidyl-tRNA synthetase